MKTAVLYESKTGYVKKYADWLAQELQADLFKTSNFNAKDFEKYDAVILGGGLYAGGIPGVKFLKANFDKLSGKKVAVFGTGASPGRQEVIDEVRNRNFSQDEQKNIKFFYMRGGFDFSKLPFHLKFVMLLMKYHLKFKKEKTPDDRGMLEAFDHPVDFTKKENIKEIVDYIRS